MDDVPDARAGRFTPDLPCRNCGDVTAGNYCPTCGQAKRGIDVSVRTLLADVLEDQLVLSRALPRTLTALFLHPGLLTTEYVEGKIVRYIAPFRLYLASSVLFFLLFAALGLRTTEEPAAGSQATATAEQQPWARNFGITIGGEETSRRVRERVVDRFGHLPPERAARAFAAEYIRFVPRVVFVLLPVFAAMLKVLYVRSGRYYAEHFVFSLHVHAFVFAMLSLMVLTRWLPALLALDVVIAGYVLAAMKRVYAQGWLVTTLKAGVLGLAYSFVVTTALVGAFAYTLLEL